MDMQVHGKVNQIYVGALIWGESIKCTVPEVNEAANITTRSIGSKFRSRFLQMYFRRFCCKVHSFYIYFAARGHFSEFAFSYRRNIAGCLWSIDPLVIQRLLSNVFRWWSNPVYVQHLNDVATRFVLPTIFRCPFYSLPKPPLPHFTVNFAVTSRFVILVPGNIRLPGLSLCHVFCPKTVILL
jgi:hypothetical protein